MKCLRNLANRGRFEFLKKDYTFWTTCRMIECGLKRVAFGTNNQFVRGYQENVTYLSDKTCNFLGRVSQLHLSDAVPYDCLFIIKVTHENQE